MSRTVQDFYKATITQDWSIGTGNFYVSVKPTVSEGWLYISPNNAAVREKIYYNGTGTDGNGDYITVTQRGVGVTDEQTHIIGEPVRMNVGEDFIKYMTDSIDAIVAAGTPDADTSTAGKVEIATDAEVLAGTEIGDTGAKLVATPGQIKTQLDSLSGSFEAGEDIKKGDALFLSLNEPSRKVYNTTTSSGCGTMTNGTYYKSNTWTTPNLLKMKIKKIIIFHERASYSGGGTNFGTFQILIRAVDGSNNPIGADLFTSDVVQISTSNDAGERIIPFTTPAELNPNTNYAFIIKYISTDTDEQMIKGGGTPTGFVKGNQSTDGSTWSDLAVPFCLKIDFSFGDIGKVYKTNATYPQSSNFFGFAIKDTLATETCYVKKGACPFFTGLTIGSYYYLSNTSGKISSTAGTIHRKIGMASSATEIFSGYRPKLSNSSISIVANEPIPFDGMYYVEQATASPVNVVIKDENGNTVQTISWGSIDSDKLSQWLPVNAGYSVSLSGVLTPIDYI